MNNQSAFPIYRNKDTSFSGAPLYACEDTGMTLRDYFAGQALASSDYTLRVCSNCPTPEQMALGAYVLADAMLEAREEKTNASERT